MTVKVKAATLTIDTVEQFYPGDQARGQGRRARARAGGRAPRQAIVFARTKIRSEQLYRTLRDRGMNVKALHGDMTQGARDGVMISFKDGRLPILVATDVAARGLDISTVTHIVNFDIPTSPDVYVHRIGRTGRVGRSGRAITFVEPRQRRELEAIERHAGTKVAPWAEGAQVAPAPLHERAAATASRTTRTAPATGATRSCSLRAAARPGSPRPTSSTRHVARRPRRRGDAERAGARAVRAARGPGRRGRARGRGRRRHLGARPHAAGGAGAATDRRRRLACRR